MRGGDNALDRYLVHTQRYASLDIMITVKQGISNHPQHITDAYFVCSKPYLHDKLGAQVDLLYPTMDASRGLLIPMTRKTITRKVPETNCLEPVQKEC